MEILNGLATLRQLPSDFKQKVPITMYSTEDSLRQAYLDAGAVGYIEKRPGSHSAIVTRMKELLVVPCESVTVGLVSIADLAVANSATQQRADITQHMHTGQAVEPKKRKVADDTQSASVQIDGHTKRARQDS